MAKRNKKQDRKDTKDRDVTGDSPNMAGTERPLNELWGDQGPDFRGEETDEALEEAYERRRRRPHASQQVPGQEREGSTIDEPLDETAGWASTDESPTNYALVDVDSDDEDYPLDSEEVDDMMVIGTDPDDVMDEMEQYTDDDDVLEDFRQRQQPTAGNDELLEKILQYTGRTPDVTGGDIDASWETVDQSGEEAVGGTVSTPDQDRVDDLGEAVGIEYEYDEPLHTFDKLQERDEHRWELDPHSVDDEEEVEEDEEEIDERDDI